MNISVRSIACALLMWAGVTAAAGVIPRPASVEKAKGYYVMPEKATYSVTGADSLPGVEATTQLRRVKKGRADVAVRITGKGSPESYILKVTPKGVSVTAPDEAGAFYAVQTLRQLAATGGDTIAAVAITDAPRFPYRGLHFDVSRHFRPVKFLEKQLDAMAMLKMNRMHLHLTDGAGWRMPVESYPRLTEYAAWRPQRTWQDWADNGAGFCESTQPGAYGGFYTKEQLRHLVDYAAKRNIVIIPEIEMPGHSEEVIAAYPVLGCDGATGGSDLCPGKEQVFAFLERVLDEVIEVFPSEYIHIGGDEASMANWSKCDSCQARMKAEGLDDVHQLQSYLIHRIERYLNDRGRNIIGWDEILQGGLAPNATVMSWRGQDGGLKAIEADHDVVMTPGEFVYLDYCQDAPFREPVSIGGYTPLEKVYSYEPMHPSIAPERAHRLLGVQGNLWTEYITEDSHAEYMYYPRAYAIAEIGWSPVDGKDYADFRGRAVELTKQMRKMGWNTFDLENEFGERPESLAPVRHLACGAKVEYQTPYSEKYPAAGESTLTDGIRGGWTNDKRWQGFSTEMTVTLDLGAVKPVHFADVPFLHAPGAWIHLPDYVEISTSTDGKAFTPAARIYCDVDMKSPKSLVRSFAAPLEGEARYVRVHAPAPKRDGAWLFTDEIIVN